MLHGSWVLPPTTPDTSARLKVDLVAMLFV